MTHKIQDEAQLDLWAAARDAAVAAADAAARLIRSHAGRLDDAQQVREKGVHDLVTEVDEAAQAIILEVLGDAFPSFAVLAEEGPLAARPMAPNQGYRWIIDPIDGTTNFTHGVPPYAVSIALQLDGDVVVGVVLDVARGDRFTAIRGQGAFMNGRKIQVSPRQDLGECLITTGFPYRSFGHVDLYLGVLKHLFNQTRGVRRPGVASIDLAYVACGRFEAFFETGLMPWDVAAGILLVEEAGGRVSDYRGAPNPTFTQQILATNGLCHASMLEAVRPMRAVYG